ncbi:cytochrome P450 [Streptomyces longispororuber]|uniref:cytochrome P450 n=1 Tax=Streptomyces longispororuber TaxID=68230 RepID=UPI00210C1AA9|nr:cytochrome P450 [Streptomyces longispororuber]MCQ4207082.1 cytochrome P450 [Streptomyces longispororuber]
MNDKTVREDLAGPEPVGGDRPVRAWALEDLPALTFDPLLADVLREEPVARVRMPFGTERDAWLVTRYPDVRLVTSDPRFSRSALVGREVNGMMAHRVAATVGLNYADPPDHTRLRKVMTKAFTGRTMKGLRPLAEHTAAELLDAMEEAGPPADLVAHLHGPFPLAVVSDLLGVPAEDRARLADWPDVILSAGPGPKSSEAAKERMRRYIVELLADRRGSTDDDLASVLARAEAAGEISEAEAVSLATAVLVSGAHAVRNNSANMVYTLLTRPELADRLRAEPELVPQAVDELLRHIPHRNGVGLPRIATEDVEVGGVLIRQGEAVYASYLAANRDPGVFAEPDTVDFDRTGTAHLSFGHGPHHCIGAMLARMESEVMLAGLLARFPGLRLAGDPAETRWQSKGFIRGPQTLLVSW